MQSFNRDCNVYYYGLEDLIMASTHYDIVRKLVKDFHALPSKLVCCYIAKQCNISNKAAAETVWDAIRNQICFYKDGYLVYSRYTSPGKEADDYAKVLAVYMEFFADNITLSDYSFPDYPWKLAFIANNDLYYVGIINRMRETVVGTMMCDKEVAQNIRNITHRIGIVDEGTRIDLIPKCGILQFCTVDEDYNLNVFTPDDRKNPEDAWADVAFPKQI